ncbi:hypothetical protein KIL84_015864 [Mauremys mutica]|uniref:Uncharacterized protein n=1 Tax=Mauremys mutica TaxID=74926 RepID=A0A9D4AMC8_9SAUR|nr:hypothetical protein KIL84_015864 [Mauremys mutica]
MYQCACARSESDNHAHTGPQLNSSWSCHWNFPGRWLHVSFPLTEESSALWCFVTEMRAAGRKGSAKYMRHALHENKTLPWSQRAAHCTGCAQNQDYPPSKRHFESVTAGSVLIALWRHQVQPEREESSSHHRSGP